MLNKNDYLGTRKILNLKNFMIYWTLRRDLLNLDNNVAYKNFDFLDVNYECPIK